MLAGLIATALMVGAVPAAAEIVKDDAVPDSGSRSVFARLAAAWEAGDERALANLVHRDGLNVTDGGAGDRGGHYSPSQAYYYFKNLFRAHRTLSFEFRMMQDGESTGRARGIAEWHRRRVDSEVIQTYRVICVLARDEDRWRLAELNTIR